MEKALTLIDEAINKTKDNPSLYFARGSIYDMNMKQPDKAVIDYKKAIELNPKYFDAYYNIGALYFNSGVEMYNNNEQDQAKFDSLQAKGVENFKLALPFLEKAHELDPKDVNTLLSLKELYYRLQMMDKWEAIKKEIEALKK
jgi:tetratricopeptide (TPR) repeat protein